MAADANPPVAAADEERLVEIADELADRLEAAVPEWIERLVLTRVQQWCGDVSSEAAGEAAAAATSVRADTIPQVRALLAADVDEQRGNPLDLLRRATSHAHDALVSIGVPGVERDEFSERSFPDDTYDLVPATWSDIDPALHEIGLTWGAAKAFVHKARRRAEGRA